MNDDSLDKLFREKVLEQESIYPSRWSNADVLWKSLNEKRDRRKTKQRRLLWEFAAAAVLITVLAGIFFIPNRSGNVRKQNEDLATSSSQEQDALEFIANYCAQKNISCSAPVIQELRSELEQSYRKLKEIDGQLQRYGNDAELIRAKGRIESHQVRLIKTIVQKL